MAAYGNRTFARFYALETIARVPYFSYTSVLHLFETIGFFRQKEFIKLHFSESWNEMHHLLIMEFLGGNEKFEDRFIAQHIAFAYYW
jgi:ubiquinol oxidase